MQKEVLRILMILETAVLGVILKVSSLKVVYPHLVCDHEIFIVMMFCSLMLAVGVSIYVCVIRHTGSSSVVVNPDLDVKKVGYNENPEKAYGNLESSEPFFD